MVTAMGRYRLWLVAGSSPSVLRSAEVRTPVSRVIAVSRAIEVIPKPDVYVFKDRSSAVEYSDRISDILADRRTVVAPMWTFTHLRPNPRPAWWDQVIYVDRRRLERTGSPGPMRTETNFGRMKYPEGKLSGPWGVCWAINHGAEEIDIMGFEGVVQVEGGIPVGPFVEQARILQAMAVACPDIMFRYYGTLVWDIVGPNVEVIA